MSQPHRILTRFTFIAGDGSITEVPFRIQRDRGSGTYRDWDIREIVEATHIPGTNITYEESLGFEPATVTWRLRFTGVNDYNRLLSLYGKTGTLTVLAGYQSLKGVDYHASADGRDYTDLDQVTIRAISDTPHEVGGSVEASVTFTRAIDPVTREAGIA